MTQSIYIPRGVNTEALSQSIMWDYQPQGFKVCFLFSVFGTSILTYYRLFFGIHACTFIYSLIDNQNRNVLVEFCFSTNFLLVFITPCLWFVVLTT